MLDELLEAIAGVLSEVDGDDDVDELLDTDPAEFDGLLFDVTSEAGSADIALADIGDGAVDDADGLGSSERAEPEGLPDYPDVVDRAFAAIKSPDYVPKSNTGAMVDAQMATLHSELGAIADMSPEQRESYTAIKNAQIGAVDTQIQAERFDADVRRDVTDSMRKLSESDAKSYAPFTYTPAESGLTLSDVDVPVGESETTTLGNGIIEYDGRQYRRLLNGSYERIE
ncbi:hypothetical protein [Halobaculum roseum]|uniref:Uncharacterized protein n=1 Tax=Halobaculum roseum TaxID=2175149 RepID=A0ABD5MUA7_9EURY|nr:hypothetical protein [Halobaculum roseum]QZY04549.1 hypothetical protein K6T36_16450 [Halobaculum roseum]